MSFWKSFMATLGTTVETIEKNKSGRWMTATKIVFMGMSLYEDYRVSTKEEKLAARNAVKAMAAVGLAKKAVKKATK